MAEFRIEKSGGYTVISNHPVRNSVLSLKAKGLLWLILSLPDNWDYTVAGLAHICVEGKDAIRAALQELEQAGYVERCQTRDENGKMAGNEYIIRDEPVPPLSENSTADSTVTENPTELNKDISIKDLSKKKSKKEKASKADKASLTREQVEQQLHDWYWDVIKDASIAQADHLWRDLMLYLDHRDALGNQYTDKGGVTALTNKLLRYSDGDLAVMCEVLETTLEHGWRGIHPLKGSPKGFRGAAPPEYPSNREEKRWL